MIRQITFWFSPAVEATNGLESCDIACIRMISQHSHVILFCHGTFRLIALCGMSRTQWVLLTCEWGVIPSHSQTEITATDCGYSCWENCDIDRFHGKTVLSVISTGKLRCRSIPRENCDIGRGNQDTLIRVIFISNYLCVPVHPISINTRLIVGAELYYCRII